MTIESIESAEFEHRLARLCGGGGTLLPRKERDRQIILRSLVQGLDTARAYSEARVNEWVARHASEIGLEMDHVALRRYLVDAGYLIRDAGGSVYRVRPDGSRAVRFGPEVSEVDPAAVVRQARQENARRKRERMARIGSESIDAR